MLEQKLNRFLWCGQDSKAKVAWDKVCAPKKEGGLGLRRLEVWNKAAMLNHIWNLFVQAGSLWVAWVECNWLKGRSFWKVSPPHPCPWSWRKILKLRDLAKQFLHFRIGDGSKVFFWLDNWHPDGCLLDVHGFRVVYDVGSHLEAKVSSIIRNGGWFWNGARSDIIVAIQCRLLEVSIGGKDMPVWRTKKGTYSCYETWDVLREKLPTVSWWRTVWFSKAIPKHSFILWLVFRDALPTKDRMSLWGYVGNLLFPFCYGCLESRDNLFFSCSFSSRVWKKVIAACFISNPRQEWEDIAEWSSAELKGESLWTTLCRLCLGASVYHL